MKKILFALIVVVLCLSFIGCNNDNQTSNNQPQQEIMASSTSPALPKDDESSKDKLDAEEDQMEVVFDPLTVADNDECSIVLTDIDVNIGKECTIKANLENKSNDITYMFSIRGAAVNGLETDPFWAEEVAPGKKSISAISFSNSDLKKNNIDFSDIELAFVVYDSNDWMADKVIKDTIHVYPFGEENAKTFVRAPQNADEIILDGNGVTATVIGYDKDDIWGYTIELYLQNSTDTEVMFGVDEASVNGYMADPFWAASVLPGKSKFSSMSWSNSELREIGVTDVEEIEFLFRARDNDDWFSGSIAEERVILNPQI